MRFGDIHDSHLPLGRVTVWRATDETLARSIERECDPRGPSHNQFAHISRALTRRVDPELLDIVDEPTGDKAKAAPTGWLGVSFDVAHVNRYCIRRALEAWIARHETLRSGFRATSPGVDSDFERFTLDPGEVSLEEVDLGLFVDRHLLSNALDDLFNRSTDAVTWPSYAFAAIQTASTTTLVLAFDHVNIDGYSILLAVTELRELVDADYENRPHTLASVASYVDFAHHERLEASQAPASHPALAPWRDFLGSSGTLPRFPLPDGLPPGSQIPQQTQCIDLLSDAEADAFSVWCRAHGVGSAVGYLAAMALATGRCREASPAAALPHDPELGSRRGFRSLVSTHTRFDARWANALGWFTAVAPFTVNLDDCIDLGAVLQEAGPAWVRAKQGATLPMARVSELLDVPLEPRFVVSYIDARHARMANRWKTWNAQAYLGDVGPTDEVYLWINRVPGETYVTWRFPGNDECAAQITTVSQMMRTLIVEAIALSTESSIAPTERYTQWS